MPRKLSAEHRQKIKENHAKHWLGKRKPLSEEAKRKIGETLKGHPVSAETRQKIGQKSKGRTPWNKGKPWPEQMRKRISETNKMLGIEPTKKFVGFGSDSPRWKGGVTPLNHKIRTSLEYKLWRTAVFERDGYACVWCGAKSGKGKKVVLHADHIKQFAFYPELRFAIDNGRTLCEPCHRTTDTYANSQSPFLPDECST